MVLDVDKPVSDVDTDLERINITNIPLTMIRLIHLPRDGDTCHCAVQVSNAYSVLSFSIDTIFKEANY